MAEVAGTAAQRARSPWWLRLAYAVVLVSAAALVVLVIGDLVAALESEKGELHHLFVFDLAWPVFLITAMLALISGFTALVGGAVRRNAAAIRYSAWALGYCALAVVVVAVSEAL